MGDHGRLNEQARGFYKLLMCTYIKFKDMQYLLCMYIYIYINMCMSINTIQLRRVKCFMVDILILGWVYQPTNITRYITRRHQLVYIKIPLKLQTIISIPKKTSKSLAKHLVNPLDWFQGNSFHRKLYGFCHPNMGLSCKFSLKPIQ